MPERGNQILHFEIEIEIERKKCMLISSCGTKGLILLVGLCRRLNSNRSKEELNRNTLKKSYRQLDKRIHTTTKKVYVEECRQQQINWCFANLNVLQPVVPRNAQLHAATIVHAGNGIFFLYPTVQIWTWKYAANIQSDQKPTNNEIDYIHHTTTENKK